MSHSRCNVSCRIRIEDGRGHVVIRIDFDRLGLYFVYTGRNFPSTNLGLRPENANYTQWFAERGMATVYREDYGFAAVHVNSTTIYCEMYNDRGQLLFDIVRPVRDL